MIYSSTSCDLCNYTRFFPSDLSTTSSVPGPQHSASIVHSSDRSPRRETSQGLPQPLGFLPDEILCAFEEKLPG